MSVPSNLRDVGGLPGPDGRRLRERTLLRSHAPAAFGQEELGMLASAGLAAVADLRSPTERERHPSPWPEPAPALLPFERNHTGLGISREWADRLATDPDGGYTRESMLQGYAGMPVSLGGAVAAAITHLAGGGGPLLIHCSAGKDRTGVVTALILEAAGIDREQILADYMVSDERFGAAEITVLVAALTELQLPAPVAEALRCRPAYLEQAWETVDSGHGGIGPYLAALGIDDGARDALAAALLIN